MSDPRKGETMPKRPDYCKNCGESLRSHTGSYCEECGEPIVDAPRITTKDGRPVTVNPYREDDPWDVVREMDNEDGRD